MAEKVDLFYYDLKLIDSAAHTHFTGADNALILSNLRLLSSLGASLVIRVPLVPGVTDTDENLNAIAETVRNLPGLVRVDLLPYNRAAGGKYRNLGLKFCPLFDEQRELRLNAEPFEKHRVPVRIAGLICRFESLFWHERSEGVRAGGDSRPSVGHRAREGICSPRWSGRVRLSAVEIRPEVAADQIWVRRGVPKWPRAPLESDWSSSFWAESWRVGTLSC